MVSRYVRSFGLGVAALLAFDCGYERAATQGAGAVFNDVPVLAGAVIRDAVYVAGSTLSVEPQGFSDRETNEALYYFEWWRNGVPVVGADRQTLRGVFLRGDKVWAEVWPFDGVCAGLPVTSNTVGIENSLPVLDGAFLGPGAGPFYEASVLEAYAGEATDADGDTVHYVYQWYVNDVPVGADGEKLTGAYFAKGDRVYVEITPGDALALGEPIKSPAVTIADSWPHFAGPVTLVQSGTAVTATATAVDPDGEAVPFVYEWLHNGGVVAGQSAASLDVGAYQNDDEIRVRVRVQGLPALPPASSAIFLRNLGGTCDEFPAGVSGSSWLTYADCTSRNVFQARLTESTDAVPAGDRKTFVEQTVRENMVTPLDNDLRKGRFVAFVDLALKRVLDGRPATAPDYEPGSYQYLPVTAAVGPYKPGDPGCVVDPHNASQCINRTIGRGGYEALRVGDRECIDVPLVGWVCLNGYVSDRDNAAGARFFNYAVTNASFDVQPSGAQGTNFTVTLTLHNPAVDVFFEPPTDVTGPLAVADVFDDTGNPAYVPAADLSRYVKANGYASFQTATAVFAVAFTQPALSLDFRLKSIAFSRVSAFSLVNGPYCNNNLGTVEMGAGAVPQQRPFRPNGMRRYAGLVSDTAGNMYPGQPRQTYYAQTNVSAYPHAASNIYPTGVPGEAYGGGSGVGRDRLGVETLPYESDNAQHRWSDHPLNCKFPADGCSVTAAQAGGMATRAQNGGPQWNGVSGSCEYPNVSNNADDATFQLSQQLSSWLPYVVLPPQNP